MFAKMLKLPVNLVLMVAVLMLIIGLSGIGIKFHFTNQLFVAAMVFLCGFLIILLGGHTFRKANTTISPLQPEQASCLVTTGVYRLSRNPMYIGFLLWLLAWAILLGNVLNLLFLPLFIMLVNKLFIVPEETALEKIFGEDFQRYKASVRRWL